jgi:hypothetical protein
MHKRSTNKLQQRKIQTIIQNGSYHDKQRGETISRLTREEIMGKLKEPVEVHLIPDIEKGEVLIDPYGRGSLQTMSNVGSRQESQKSSEKGSHERNHA